MDERLFDCNTFLSQKIFPGGFSDRGPAEFPEETLTEIFHENPGKIPEEIPGEIKEGFGRISKKNPGGNPKETHEKIPERTLGDILG